MKTKTFKIKDSKIKVFEMYDQIFGVLKQYDIPIEQAIEITTDISKRIAYVLELE